MPELAQKAEPLETMAIVVVNFGSHALIEHNLGPVALPDHVRVVIVDNFSSLDEAAAIEQLCGARRWELIALADNRGFGAATNTGIRRGIELGCSCFLLLNPDASVSADVIAQLRSHSQRDHRALLTPRIVASTGQVVYGGSQVQLTTGRISGRGLPDGDGGATVHLSGQVPSMFDGPTQGWLPGACLVIHREMFERVGGFAERYFLYWEDVDLSRRVELAGGSLQVRHDLIAVHDEGGTQRAQGTRGRSNTYYYYNCRNRLLFAADHLSKRLTWAWMLRTPVESWQILMRGGKRQLLQSPGPLVATVRGSVAGLWLALRALMSGPTRPDAPASRARPREAAGQQRVLVAHPGVDLYGSDRVMLESVSALVDAGVDVTVALPAVGPLTGEVQARGAHVTTCPMPVLRKSALRPRGLLRLTNDTMRSLVPTIRLIRHAGRDGVYVSTLTIPLWVLLGRALGRRVICHVHEAEASAAPVLRWAMALPLIAAHRLVVNSRFSVEVLARSVPALRARARVVYNAVPGPETGVPPRADVDGPVRLAFVGRLSPRKGPNVAIAAVAELMSRHVDVRLQLLGDVFPGYEWFQRELHEQVRLAGLEGRIEFAGFDPMIWPHLLAADIVIVPSVVDEPFGNTAVEAVLGARPLVVSATSGLHEAADGYRSAQFVPPGDPAAIADAVQRIIGDWPQFRAWALADTDRARLRHGCSAYRRRIVELVVASPP